MLKLNKKERKALAQKKWRAKKRKDREELWLPVYRIYTEEEKEEMKKMRAEWWTLISIAEHFWWKISTIWKICKDIERDW